MRYLAVCLFLCSSLLAREAAGPWGKDAELAHKPPFCCEESRPQGAMQKVAEYAIGFHQNVVSPADGPRSHFFPSSSSYTLQAIRKYGFLRGWIMGCDRLMRENNEPWIYPTGPGRYGCLTKYDPVK